MTHPSDHGEARGRHVLQASRAALPVPFRVASVHSSRCALYPGQKIKDTHPELFKGPLPPSEPHAACRLSYVDDGTACGACARCCTRPDACAIRLPLRRCAQRRRARLGAALMAFDMKDYVEVADRIRAWSRSTPTAASRPRSWSSATSAPR
jgi:hypothetical protein